MENRGTNLKKLVCDVLRESQMPQNPKNKLETHIITYTMEE
jgi:hypothetical protein